MNITATYNNHSKKTYRRINFDLVDSLPEVGEIQDIPHDIRSIVSDVKEITEDISIQSGWEDLRFFIIWLDVERYVLDEDESGIQYEYLEPEGEDIRYIAIHERKC